MPSFYNSRQMPLTPPEYSTGFHNSNCSGIQYQSHGYGAQQYSRQDEMMYDYIGRYTQPSAVIHQQQAYPSTVGVPPANRYNDATCLTLPPVRSLEQSLHADPYQRPPEYRQYEQRSQQKPKDEKPVGGVSAKLDYDMEWMTDFVATTAQQLYDFFTSPFQLADIDIIKSVQSSTPSKTSFRGWVNSVLCATRLPSATIVLSLRYLSIRMTRLQASSSPDRSENAIYRMLTVALIMGSKFLDDNTFINRSWADVSGIDIRTLNHMEREWLCDINWNLHLDPAESAGFNEWLDHWKQYEKNALSRGAQSLKLSPIDTNVQHHSPAHKSFSPPSAVMGYTPMSGIEHNAQSFQSGHHISAYAPYDPWLVRRSANDSSPNSAPHTGPTTPEYYGGPGTWAPLDSSAYAYSRRGYGFGQLSQSQHMAQPYTPFTPTYNQQNAWTGHSIHCSCGHCSRQQIPYWAGSHYGQQPIVA
jgi:hypothetical protein